MRAKLIQKTWMDMNIVAWCVCVAEAYCPHLGSDQGPPRGGGRMRWQAHLFFPWL